MELTSIEEDLHMRRALYVLAVLLLTSLLAGCACAHEWTQPDCMNPAVCTKCDETGEEALGHNWAPASCESPETCLNCGATQGDAPGHDWTDASCTTAQTCRSCGTVQGDPSPHVFEDWMFDLESEIMQHICSNCSYEESSTLDREVYLESLLTGCWEFSMLFRDDSSYYSSYSFSEPMDQLFFGDHHQVTGSVTMESFEGTWEFQEYIPEEDADLYSFLIPNVQGKVLPAMLVTGGDTDYLYLYYNESDSAVLQRHDEAAAALSGTWGAEGGSGICSLTLNPDRTVTGNIDGAFTGTWQLLDILDHELLGKYCGLYIRFERNGEEIFLHGTATPEYLYSDTPSEEFHPSTISITHGRTKLEFTPMSQEEIEARQEQMSVGSNMLIGTWSSMYYRSFDVQPNKDTLAMDYTVTFFSDGTFTASVGKEIRGTWQYDSQGSTPSGRYNYYFFIEGDNYPYDMTLEYTDTHVPQLWMEGRSTLPGGRRMLFLNKRSSQQDQMARSLIGTWTSIYIEDPNTANGRINTMDFSFTFHENGTFTGSDGATKSGTWVYERTRDETVHQFNLVFNGQAQERASITMYDHSNHGDETEIDYSVSTDSGTRYIRLVQLSAEDLENAQLGPTFLLGEWEDSDGNSICFLEDGTFTANLDTVIQGTWSFRRYKPGSGYWYDFTFPGQSQYCDKTMYGHPDENTLTFRIETEDSKNFYSMHRNQ